MSNALRSRTARRGYWAAGTALAAVALGGILAPSAFAAGSPPPAIYTDMFSGTRFAWTGGPSNTVWGHVPDFVRAGFDAAVSPDGQTAYFLEEQFLNRTTDVGTVVTPVTVATGQAGLPIATLPGTPLSEPSRDYTRRRMALSPDGSVAYVSGLTGITAVTLSTGAVGAEWPTGLVAALAVSTNGRFVYATVGNNLLELDAKTGAEQGRIALGQPGGAIKVSANGRTAYVIADTTGATGAKLVKVKLSNFTINAQVDVAGSTRPTGTTSRLGLALSPDQSQLYVTGASGTPAFFFALPVSAATLQVGNMLDVLDVGYPVYPTNDAAFSPDGKTLYMYTKGDQGSNVFLVSVDVATNTVKDKSRYADGSNSEAADSVVVPGDQAPVAAFTEKAGCAGTATAFDASASTVAVGTIVRYAWNFGDGSTRVTAGPTVKHSYTNAGTSYPSVTETDSDGTSTSVVFDGQTVLLNGGPSAQARQTITVKACAAVKAKDVSAAQAAPSSEADLTSLPRTGTQTSDELIVGGLLLVGGAGLVSIARKHRG